MECSKCHASIRPSPGIIERLRHGELEYSHRICPRRLKRSKETKYQLSKPKKRGWNKARQPGLTTMCEITGQAFASVRQGKRLIYLNRIVDHLVPERLAAETGKDPHARVNLICIHANVHGRKRAAEDGLLKRGDMLTYLQELNRQGFPMDRVHAALRFYGLEREVLHKKQPPTQHTGELTDGNDRETSEQ